MNDMNQTDLTAESAKFVAGIATYAIFQMSPDGTITTWNEGVKQVKGYEASSFIGHHFSIVFTDEDVKIGRPEWEMKQAATHSRFQGEGWRRHADGSRYWAQIVLTALYDETGTLSGFIKVTQDNTAKKKETDLLRRNLDNYHHIVEQVEDYAIFMISPDGYIMTWNKGTQKIKGFKAEDFIGQHFQILFTEEDIKAGRPDWEMQFARKHGRFESEAWRVRKDGSRFWASAVLTAIHGDDNELIGYTKVTRDASERKRSDEATRLARQSADEANDAKSTFLANMGHEIRTPLGVILGFTDLVLGTEGLSPEIAGYMSAILRNGRQLEILINEILDLSKVEAGCLQVEQLDVNLTNFLQDLGVTFRQLAQKKELRFELVSISALPHMIKTDANRLRQILLNVVGNAIKFTETGSVTLKVEFASTTHRDVEDQLVFVVTDTGIGMTLADQDLLFQKFKQADASIVRRFGGTGLGLALAKSLTRALGGDIALVQSRPGMGSVFRITVNVGHMKEVSLLQDPGGSLSQIIRPVVASPATGRLDGLKVLLAEDAPDNQFLISSILGKAGAEIDVASNGDEVILKALHGEHDLILMDLQMPKRDGNDAMQQLRSQGYKKPIVALTAHAMKDECDRGIASGFNDYLTKPINSLVLINTIGDLTARSRYLISKQALKATELTARERGH
ncbi:MAG: PAS domain S-box protein [Pseudobdellovibrionaceae bacterium]|nr:PAS domain S-box protein [Pseudobdellovibrionaceae bacterium]